MCFRVKNLDQPLTIDAFTKIICGYRALDWQKFYNNVFKLMIMRIYSKQAFLQIGFFLVTTFFLSTIVFAQDLKPKQENLLNGLKILMWNEPKSDKVALKLRIHSGAMFDPKDKMGTMTLLADSFFPEEGLKTFITDELGGSLVVTSNYDYIQVDISSRADSFDKILEILQTAVIETPISKENFAKLRDARLKKVNEDLKDPAIVADQGVAKRLFGNFPYGNPMNGTPESLAKLDRNDLLTAKDRFVTADNATLVIIGNFDSAFAVRACKQFFGSWQKSDKLVPPTFRQPDAPKQEILKIEMADIEKSYNRNARNTVGRSDKDYFATQIVTDIWKRQFCFSDESKRGELRYQSYLLRGVFYFSSSTVNPKPKPEVQVTSAEIAELPINSSGCSFFLLKDGKPVYPAIAESDFTEAKNQLLSGLQQKIQMNPSLSELWLDVDTYKLGSVKDVLTRANNVSFAAMLRVAENLQKEPVVTVNVTRKADVPK